MKSKRSERKEHKSNPSSVQDNNEGSASLIFDTLPSTTRETRSADEPVKRKGERGDSNEILSDKKKSNAAEQKKSDSKATQQSERETPVSIPLDSSPNSPPRSLKEKDAEAKSKKSARKSDGEEHEKEKKRKKKKHSTKKSEVDEGTGSPIAYISPNENLAGTQKPPIQ